MRQETGFDVFPYASSMLDSALRDRGLEADIRAVPGLMPDRETARALNWRGRIWIHDGAASDRTGRLRPGTAERLSADEDDHDQTDITLEAATPKGPAIDFEEGSRPDDRLDIDARIPFVLDAPGDSEDELDHQYVQPPWWQVFLTIQGEIAKEIRQDAVADLKAAWDDPRRIEPAVNGLFRWLGLGLQRIAYQVWNSKLKTQLTVWALIGFLAFASWQLHLVDGIVDLILVKGNDGTSVVDAKKAGEWIGLAVAILALGGASISALFTIISQSLAPDLDFTAEHKQIGARERLARQILEDAPVEAQARVTEALRQVEIRLAPLVDNAKSVGGLEAGAARLVEEVTRDLATSLPEEQQAEAIKRIFMAFAVYEVVGRTFFQYQLTEE
eukprot:gene12333-biopygen10755